MRYIGINIILLIFLTFESCKYDEIKEPCLLEDVQSPIAIGCKLTNDLDTVKLYILGTWTWLQEERIQRGVPIQYLTPKNQGYNRTLELITDTAKFYKCGQIKSTFKFSIKRLKEISGTNFPEDDDPILVFYNLQTGIRSSYVPLRICDKYLILQGQYVSSIAGEETWRRK